MGWPVAQDTHSPGDCPCLEGVNQGLGTVPDGCPMGGEGVPQPQHTTPFPTLL